MKLDKPACHGALLIELMLSMSVLSVALLGLSAALLTSIHLGNLDHEQNMALNIAQQKLAEMQEYPQWSGVGGVFDYYRSASHKTFTNSDPNLADVGNGNNFAAGTVSTANFTGRIFFPVDNPDSPTANLIENYTGGQILADGSLAPLGALMGMPRSLNNNTSATETVGLANYLVLPVTLRVSWIGTDGAEQQVELHAMLFSN